MDIIAGGPDPASLVLTCGPLSIDFEPGTAFLRYIRFEDHEVLRGIYVAVRDHNWDTIPAEISDPNVQSTPDGFELSFRASHVDTTRGIDFLWRGVITFHKEGRLAFEMDGEARSTFSRNRIGFCILHPYTCAGAPCVVRNVDGTETTGRFPSSIAPHQPFLDMASITHEVAPGVQARVEFQGDVFEMEDQRNWTDASYKTYCTPLALPFPVEVHAGTRIYQRIDLTLLVDTFSGPALRKKGPPVRIEVHSQSHHALPRIGTGIASAAPSERTPPLDPQSLDRLKKLGLAHLRVDLDLTRPGWQEVLSSAEQQARALSCSLEPALFASDAIEDALSPLLDAVKSLEPAVARWLLYHHSEKSARAAWVDQARPLLSRYGSDIPIYAGSNAYFTELNRHPAPFDAIDGVCYSINPQVHAFDNRSLVETLAIQGITLENARQLSGGTPVAVTPVTLRPRFNPNATGPESHAAEGELPGPVDRRQYTLFAAGWTMSSIKYLAEAGAQSLTYYETAGWRGLLETEAGSDPMFGSMPASVYPMYHVFADLTAFGGGRILKTASNAPLKAEALAMRRDEKGRILVANLSAATLDVTLASPPGWTVHSIRVLDATNVFQAMKRPEQFREAQPQEALSDSASTAAASLNLTLAPYAYASLDFDVQP